MLTTTVDYNSICYKRNFLKEVIARIDFINPIKSLEKEIPKKITRSIKENFPIVEPRKAIAQELQISPRSFSHKSQEFIEWNFHGKNKDKTLTISQNSIFVSYKKYESYENLKNEYLEIVNTIAEIYDDIQARRAGLRYINEIILDGDPFIWEDYLNNKILCLLSFYDNKKEISRIFNVIEFNYDIFNLRYQFGMHNPDFPAPIKQKRFILDMDAYNEGILDISEVTRLIDDFHSNIQELFEYSITDKLREILNG